MESQAYNPCFVEADSMFSLGYELIYKDGAYFKYESVGGKALKREGRTHEQPLGNGQRIIYFNTGYQPKDGLVFCSIEEDGGTRKVFYGVIHNLEEFKLILKLVE